MIFVEKFILNNWDKHIYDKNIIIIDPKTKLQEYSLKKFKIPPYTSIFLVQALNINQVLKLQLNLKDTEFVEAEGFSKKLAQQAAATKLLKILEK